MLAVNKIPNLIPFTRIIHDRSVRLPTLLEDVPMFAVRSLHVPVEWFVGGEQGIDRLERSIRRFGVDYSDRDD